ncbi:MAG: aminoglycoside phosphotransferase, partial [Verrucomicrobiota bacterium]|nr:aminoglycoside phosphotransferase [Verrucomicrobiota bacterium]
MINSLIKKSLTQNSELYMNVALMAQRFDIPGQLVTVMPFGDGNVNDTYLAIFRTTFSEERFIIQRINSNVFANPKEIMSNMRVITEHVHRRLEDEIHLSDRIWQLPRIVETKDGEDYTVDGNGSVWRGISYIHSAQAFEKIQSLDHAHEAGMVL